MRFMILRKADRETEAGVLLGAEGLQASSQSARFKFSGGKPVVLQPGPTDRFNRSSALARGSTRVSPGAYGSHNMNTYDPRQMILEMRLRF